MKKFACHDSMKIFRSGISLISALMAGWRAIACNRSIPRGAESRYNEEKEIIFIRLTVCFTFVLGSSNSRELS